MLLTPPNYYSTAGPNARSDLIIHEARDDLRARIASIQAVGPLCILSGGALCGGRPERGTPLKWIQDQGGWTTAKLLLDTYGHYMPSESHGFADVLSGVPKRPLPEATSV